LDAGVGTWALLESGRSDKDLPENEARETSRVIDRCRIAVDVDGRQFLFRGRRDSEEVVNRHGLRFQVYPDLLKVARDDFVNGHV
jgi:hypothetical protein